MPSEGFEDYLRNLGRSEHTIRAYRGDVREFRIFLGAREPSLDLLEVWAGTLNHGRLKPQTTQRKITAITGWLAFEARHGSPAAKDALAVIASGYQISPAAKQKDRSVVAPVTAAAYNQVVGVGGQVGAIAVLLWWTGARISEVVGDSLIGIPALTVEDGLALIERGDVTTFGKGGKRRILVLPSKGRECLRAWVEQRWASVPPESPLFPTSGRSVARELAKAGGVHPHAFRHAYRARLRRAGVPEEVTKALMGHGPSGVTEAYGRVSLDEMKEGVERL